MYVIFRRLGDLSRESKDLLETNATHLLTGIMDSVDQEAQSIYELIEIYRIDDKIYSTILNDNIKENCAAYSHLRRLNLELPIIKFKRKKLR
jgi:hypothetical protein